MVSSASSGSQDAHSFAIVSYSQRDDPFPCTNGGGKLFTGVLSWFPTDGYTVTLGPRCLSISLVMTVSSFSCCFRVWDQTLCAGMSPVQYTQSHGPDLAKVWRRFSTVRRGRSHLPYVPQYPAPLCFQLTLPESFRQHSGFLQSTRLPSAYSASQWISVRNRILLCGEPGLGGVGGLIGGLGTRGRDTFQGA